MHARNASKTEVAQTGRRRWRRRLRRAAFALAVLAAAFVALWLLFPFPAEKLDEISAGRVVLDRAGRPIRVALSDDEQLCLPVRLADVSPWVAKATIAAEDRRFHDHWGVDPLAAARAAAQNLSAWRTVSGASTISMQVVRLLEPRQRTFGAKLWESFRALQLESLFSKERILEEYLNRTPYGSNIVGIEAAALRYFGVCARNLSLAEAALLAGLPQSPARLRPDRHAEQARARRRYVLERMLDCGFISRDELQKAEAAPLPVAMRPLPFEAPHFAELLLARRTAGEIRSTLDLDLQRIAEGIVAEHVEELRPQKVTNGAVVIIENQTCAVRAMVGSVDFFAAEESGQVNGATSQRSPGSALKPFTYALAFDSGLCTPERVLFDVPSVYAGYTPENYDGEFKGIVTAREALVQSLNIPAIKLLKQIGVERLHSFLKSCGISTLTRSPAHYGLALTMGGVDVTLLDLCVAYSMLARGGIFLPARLCETEPVAAGRQVIGPAAAFMISDVLLRAGENNCAGGLNEPPRVAWKTGTSAGNRDAWCVGYNPEYTVGVWVGNFSGEASPALTGPEAAAPCVLETFRELCRGKSAPWFSPPPAVSRKMVCALSGRVPGEDCPALVEDLCIVERNAVSPLLAETAGAAMSARDSAVLRVRSGFPTGRRDGISPYMADDAPCTVHRRVMVDTQTGEALCAACRRGRKYEWRLFVVYEPEVEAFLRRQGMSSGGSAGAAPSCGEAWGMVSRVLPPHNPGCRALAGQNGPCILFPLDGQRFKLMDDSAHFRQGITLTAVCSPGATRVSWFVDGTLVGAGQADQGPFWQLSTGRHVVLCVDEYGRSDSAAIEVD